MRIGIIIAIAVVVIGGGVWYFTQNDTTDTNQTVNGATNTAANTSNVKSIADIMERGGSMKCTFSMTDPSGNQQWTMYVDDQKVRGDWEVATTNSSDWTGHMINDGEYYYNWGTYQGQTSATKMKLSSLETNTNATANTNINTDVETFDYGQNYSMDCDDWRADSDMFVPPSDVTFTDLTAQLESIQNTLQTQCAACDASGDEAAKASCRQALGCE